MIASLGAGLLAGLGIAMPVGAIGTYLVGLGARAPRRVAVAAALGVASTDGCYALVAVAGGAALDGVLQPAADWLQALSVLALVLLAALTVATGVRSYRRRSSGRATPGPDLLDSDADADERAVSRERTTLRPVRAYFALLGLTALNPATLAYFTALVLGTQADAAVSTPDRVVFVAAVFVASAAWQLLLIVTGAALGHLAGGRRGQLAIALISGAVMLALAARLAS